MIGETRDPAFRDVSPNGVPAPDAPLGITDDVEATSPARRSPAIRLAQQMGSRRPDLLGLVPASQP